MNTQENQNCDVCFQIKCKMCGWIANEKETSEVQSGVLKNCPKCGWSPKS